MGFFKHDKKILIITSLLFTLVLVGCTTTKPLTRLKTPENLNVSGDTLTFDKVDFATGYLIIGNSLRLETSTNSYTFEPGSYKVRVVAKAEGYLDSLFSEEIEFTVNEEPVVENRLGTPKNLVFGENTLTFDSVPNATSYVIIGEGINAVVTTNKYTFTKDGVHRVSVVAKAMGYGDSLLSQELEVIVVFPDSKPFVTSSKDITTNFKNDTLISFESVDYTFKGVYGYEIGSSDYSYSNNILTIKSSYLKTVFDSNPDKTSLIFSYTFEKGDQTHLGFITIKK